ncbi:MAG: hypothetical protein HC804_12190 [Anaerolineae bacterium]|nr:hypothetical protein [Anaerolineae bacterium]
MIAEQQLQFETINGAQLTARPLTTSDAPYLVDIFEHMSPESRYRRFQQTLDNPNPKQIWEEAQKIAQLDDEQQGGFIAFGNGRCCLMCLSGRLVMCVWISRPRK